MFSLSTSMLHLTMVDPLYLLAVSEQIHPLLHLQVEIQPHSQVQTDSCGVNHDHAMQSLKYSAELIKTSNPILSNLSTICSEDFMSRHHAEKYQNWSHQNPHACSIKNCNMVQGSRSKRISSSAQPGQDVSLSLQKQKLSTQVKNKPQL